MEIIESPGSAISFKSFVVSPKTPIKRLSFFEILDNQINEESTPFIRRKRIKSPSQVYDEPSSVYLTPNYVGKIPASSQCSPIKAPKLVDVSVQCDLNEGFWDRLLKTIMSWTRSGIDNCENRLLRILEFIKNKLKKETPVPLIEKPKSSICKACAEELALRISELENSSRIFQQELLKRINSFEEELKRSREPLKIGALPPGLAPPPPPPMPMAPSLPPPPPPPLPIFNMTSAIVKISPRQRKVDKPKETPRLTITAADLASVRLRKVSMSDHKKSNLAGQMVTVEQLRSVKLKPRRKTAQVQQSPTRTPLNRDRSRKIRSRPKREIIPLSSILNLEDSF